MYRFLTLFLVLFSCIMIAEDRTIIGTVTSADDNTPLIGASIRVKGAQSGAYTKNNGSFMVKVPEGKNILVVSYIGYQTKEVVLDDNNEIDIQLVAGGVLSDEVVVTAFGVERETKALGYAVQEVSGEEMAQVRSNNMVNNLQGKVAGVNITGGNSGVGSTSRIVIRGETSLSGDNQPLFVVDGIPITNQTKSNRQEGNLEVDYGNPAQDINPDDIESITVLKGANAAALYGARAANGVVLITTKSGKGKKGFGISVTTNRTYEDILIMPKWQNSYGQGSWDEGAQAGQFNFVDGSGSGLYDGVDESWGPRLNAGNMVVMHDSPTANGYRAGDTRLNDGAGTPMEMIANPNNIDDFYNVGINQVNTIAFTGANESGDFRLSVSDQSSSGLLPNTDYQRTNFSLNSGYKLADNLKVRATANYIKSGSRNRPNNSYGTENVSYLWLWFGRHIDMNSLRDYWQPGYEGVQQYNYNYNWHDNPFFTMYENTNSFDRNRLMGNVTLTWDIMDKLTLRLRGGTDFYTESREGKRAYSTQRFAKGQYRLDELNFQEINTDLLLTYTDQFNQDFDYSISAGGNIMNQVDNYSRLSANELSIPGVYNLGNSAIPLAQTQVNSQRQINSLFGFANFGWKNLIYLDVTARNDWSSTLPQDNNAYFYPSFTTSLIMSDILGFKSNNPISFWKVRAGWAQVGNDTDPYRLQTVYNYGTPWGDQQMVTQQADLANLDLLPEKKTSIEIGTDIRLFEGRLGLDLTYYNENTQNQILNLPVPNSSGYSSRFVNAGEIKSTGLELMLTGTPIMAKIMGKEFKWDAYVNWSTNRSEVVELAEGIETYTISSNYINVVAEEGEQMGDFYGTGLLKYYGENESLHGQYVLSAQRDENGNITNVSMNADNTLKKLGNYNPDWRAGIGSNFKWNGFSFGFLFDVSWGGEFISRMFSIGSTSGMLEHTVPGRDEGIVIPGVIAEFDENGEIIESSVTENTFVTTNARDYYWSRYQRGNEEESIFDATYIKLRQLRLGYTFPNTWFNRTPLKNLTLSLVGRNLWVWAKDQNGLGVSFDPETFSWDGGVLVPGVEDVQTPSSYSWGFTLSFDF